MTLYGSCLFPSDVEDPRLSLAVSFHLYLILVTLTLYAPYTAAMIKLNIDFHAVE